MAAEAIEQVLSIALPITFVCILVVGILGSVFLEYHWRAYAVRPRLLWTVRSVYYGGAVVLLFIMAVTTIAFL